MFVLPSRYEGLPNGVLEALAAGVAVAVSRIPGITDIVNDTQAAMAPPDDVVAWSATLDKLARSASLRARLAAGGPACVRDRFGQTAVLAKYRQCCARLLDGRAGVGV